MQPNRCVSVSTGCRPVECMHAIMYVSVCAAVDLL